MLRNRYQKKEILKVGVAIRASKMIYVLLKDHKQEQSMLGWGDFPLEEIQPTLKRIKKEIGEFSCYLALPHVDFILKTLSFGSQLKEREIAKLLHLNAEHYFTFPLSNLYYDYEFLDENKRKVRIVGSKKESINYWRNFFLKNEFNLKKISIDVLAVENFLKVNKLTNETTIYGIFICSNTDMLQVILVDNRVVFMNTLTASFSTSISLLQEIDKFLRLYEASKYFSHPVTHLLFGGITDNILSLLKENLLIPCANLQTSYNGLIDLILPLGVL